MEQISFEDAHSVHGEGLDAILEVRDKHGRDANTGAIIMAIDLLRDILNEKVVLVTPDGARYKLIEA